MTISIYAAPYLALAVLAVMTALTIYLQKRGYLAKIGKFIDKFIG